MADIEIRRPVLQAQIRWVFRTSLSHVVVQLDAIKRVAEGIKTIKHYSTCHSHLYRRLAPFSSRNPIKPLRTMVCRRASGRGAGGDARIVDGSASGDVARGAGRAGRCK